MNKAMTTKDNLEPVQQSLLGDIRFLIETTKNEVSQTINSATTLLYWEIGKRIQEDILNNERAAYGEEIVSTLSRQLTLEYGRGFSRPNLFRMILLFEQFPDQQTVINLSQRLSWSHFVEILPLKDELQRNFYAEMCRVEKWSVRTLRNKISGMLFERTAISKKPEELAQLELDALSKDDQLTPDLVFRDPYFLDFLGLNRAYQEKDLESAILREMEEFILELGVGFTFVARQKRITIGQDDFYLDLLFFHRKLRRLIAIELKLGKFKPAHKGQMELYLRWLEKHEQEPEEKSPLGLILCAEKSSEQVELLQLENSGIKVAEYMTELPSQSLLVEKLHKAVAFAKKQLEAQGDI